MNVLRYRPEIDGLRAIAVLVVVAYHAGLGTPGGYVGVDVFFVISGFLITSLILRELDAGQFTLSRFWERRARRIMPALAVVTLCTLLAGWLIMLPADFEKLGTSATWQALFGANLYFWRATGYFAGVAEQAPLLHTWSLAVEEQFYMLVPLLLYLMYRTSGLRTRSRLLLLLSTAAGVSLAFATYTVARHPAAAFYLLPSRAWELICGAIIAALPAAAVPRSNEIRNGLVALGLTGIILPAFLYTPTTHFPGIAALPPCLGTAVFIWASGRGPADGEIGLPWLSRVLATRPVVFVGLISYSLYLWHWPLLAFARYASLESLPLTLRLTLVLASAAFATLSWRFVETPFRVRRLLRERARMFQFAAAAIVISAGCGVLLMVGHGIPERFSPQALRWAAAMRDTAGIHELTAADVRADRLTRLGVADATAPTQLLLWGDSHAMAAAPAFDTVLRERGLAGLQASMSATAPVLDGYWKNEFTNPRSVKEFNDAVYDFIRRARIRYVVLAGFWEYYTDDRSRVTLDSALIGTCRRVLSTGAQPYVLLQVPHPGFQVPKALVLSEKFGYPLQSRLKPLTPWNGVRGDGPAFLAALEAAGCRIIDPRPAFLDRSTGRFMVESQGLSLYRDDHHLSTAGAQLMLAPVLRQTLGPVLSNREHSTAVISETNVVRE